MEITQDEQIRGLALQFGELFRDKIGAHIVSAGAPLSKVYADRTQLQARTIRGNSIIIVNLSAPNASVLLQGNAYRHTPCGLLEVRGERDDVVALFNAVCAGLGAARDAESAAERQQHYTRPSEQKPLQRSGWSKRAGLNALYADSRPAKKAASQQPKRRSLS